MIIRRLFGQLDLLSLDIREDQNLIEVGVSEGADADVVLSTLQREGIPTQMIRVVHERPQLSVRTLRDKANPSYPLVAGLQVATSGNCTIGANAYVNNLYGFLTASHCVLPTGSVSSKKVWQPAFDTYDQNLIGTETYDPNTFACTTNTGSTSSACRYSDIAFVAYKSSVTSNFATMAKPTVLSSSSSINLNIYDTQFIAINNSFFEASLNDTVYKIGRTTGYQKGAVTQTCIDNKPSDNPVTFLCQTQTSAFTQGGDSGGPVFSLNTDVSANLLGLTSTATPAGDRTTYSPISGFRADMNSSVIVNN